MSVIDIHNVLLDNFSFYSPEQITEKINVYDVSYSKQDFVIQTPKVIFYNEPTIYKSKNTNYYNVTICFYNYSFCEYTRNYVDKLLEIENHFYNNRDTLWKNIKLSSKNKKFLPFIKFNKTKDKAYMTLTILSDKDTPILSVFDKSKKIHDMSYIIPNSMAYCILILKNIWIKDKKLGFNWVLLQTKVFQPIQIISECLIIDEHEERDILHYHTPKLIKPPVDSIKNTFIENPTFTRFVKMKKMGIPDMVIQNKMTLEGLNYSDFTTYYSNYSNNNSNNSEVVNNVTTESINDHPIYGKFFKMKKMGIPEPVIQNKIILAGLDYNEYQKIMNNPGISNTSNPVLTSNLFSSVILKKMSDSEDNEETVVVQNKLRHIKIESTGFKPPSISDLNNMISRLKKVESVDKLK